MVPMSTTENTNAEAFVIFPLIVDSGNPHDTHAGATLLINDDSQQEYHFEGSRAKRDAADFAEDIAGCSLKWKKDDAGSYFSR